MMKSLELAERVTEITDIICRIEYRDWKFFLGEIDSHHLYLQIRFTAPNTAYDRIHIHHGRKWLISPHMSDSEIVQTALLAVLTAEEHEAREKFLYRGHPIYGPHQSADDLYRNPPKLDVRKDLE